MVVWDYKVFTILGNRKSDIFCHFPFPPKGEAVHESGYTCVYTHTLSFHPCTSCALLTHELEACKLSLRPRPFGTRSGGEKQHVRFARSYNRPDAINKSNDDG